MPSLLLPLLGLTSDPACAAPAAAHSAANDSPAVHEFVIGLSPFLDKSVKDDVYRSLIRLLVEDLPLNSSVRVFDAFYLKSIAQVTVPNLHAFTSPKTRANQFASAIGDLKRFLAQDHPKPNQPRLDFRDALRLPQLCDFLDENLAGNGGPLTLLLIGSPLYQDAKEPAFSMTDGYFPSDGHLQTSRDQSVFGMTGAAATLRPLVVHWVYFGDPWLNDLHKEKVTRFWTLYLERRSSRLATFCSDLPTALAGLRTGAAEVAAPSKGWVIDPNQSKVEMLRVSREVGVADWLTRDGSVMTGQTPPSVLVGPMKIGIRWKNNIDLDLYATPHHGAETLFFQHTRSPEGYYYKDHRSSPGREYEFIEFETPVDIREVEAYVNFYKGECPGGPRGEVRIEFDGRIYGAPFSIPAEEGNRGRSGTHQQEFWTRIPVQSILKLAPAG